MRKIQSEKKQEIKITLRDKSFKDINELIHELNIGGLPKEARGCHLISFCDCVFTKLDLTCWKISNCNFERSKFENCYLDGTQFFRSNFSDCRFINCSLREGSIQLTELNVPATNQAQFMGMKMNHVVFFECDFTGAYIKECMLKYVEFQGCFMNSCDFPNCSFEGVAIFRCNLNSARFNNVYFSFFCSISNSEVDVETLFKLADDHKEYDAYKIYNQIYKVFKAQGLDEISVQYIFLAKKFEKLSSERLYKKLWLSGLQYSCGYGEKPERVIFTSSIFIIILAVIYGLHGLSFTGVESSSKLDYAIRCLYYSVATFTSFGDGDVKLDNMGMLLSGMEIIVGVLMTAIGTASFYKKITN